MGASVVAANVLLDSFFFEQLSQSSDWCVFRASFLFYRRCHANGGGFGSLSCISFSRGAEDCRRRRCFSNSGSSWLRWRFVSDF